MLQITTTKGTINCYPTETFWRFPIGTTKKEEKEIKDRLSMFVLPKSGIVHCEESGKPFVMNDGLKCELRSKFGVALFI